MRVNDPTFNYPTSNRKNRQGGRLETNRTTISGKTQAILRKFGFPLRNLNRQRPPTSHHYFPPPITHHAISLSLIFSSLDTLTR